MARQLLETIALRSTVIGAAFGLLGVVVVSCGSDVTCGTGTTKKGDSCVAATGKPAGDGGPTGDTGPGTSNAPVTFDGVTSVSPVSDTSLLVTWSPATAALTPTNEIVYNVYLAATSGAQNFKAPTASPPGATSLVIGNLDAKTTYYVVVRAMDQDGNMDTPDTPKELSADTVNDGKAPVFAGATRAVALKGSGNSVTVSWDPATDDLTAPEGMVYEVFWSDGSSKGSVPSTLGAVTAPGANSAVVTHLKPLSSYSFYVKARDAAGNESVDDKTTVVSGDTGADVSPPVFGGCVAVTNPGAANATVTWEPAVDDTSSPDHITYNVYAVTDPVDDQTVFNLPNGSFTGVTTGVVPGLLPETTYNFVCRAQDEAMNEDTNISYRIATTLADNRPPVFKGISNTVVAATTATLTWEAATDNETDATQIQYVVYQSTDPNPVKSGIAINPGPELGATSISIGDLTSNTTYFWAVVAQDSAGNASPPSKDVSAQTLVSFAGDVQPIFTTNCAKSGCHSSNAPMQGQDLSEGNAYLNIVSVPARYPTNRNPNFGCQSLNRIQPGDVDKSFLVAKIEHSIQLTSATACTAAQKAALGPYPNAAGCCTCPVCTDSNTWDFGLGMPKDLCIADPSCATGGPSNPGLPQTAIDTIKTWITQGALDN